MLRSYRMRCPGMTTTRYSLKWMMRLVTCGACLALGACSIMRFDPAPTVTSAKVSASDMRSWLRLDKQARPGRPMGQRWRGVFGQVEGAVQVAHNGSYLFVYAELPDIDIFNPATQFNEESWNQGDIFEIFIRPEGQNTYYEFHVSPNNQRFQLRFTKQATASDNYERALSRIPVQSKAVIRPAENKWQVYVMVPLKALLDPNDRPLPDRWHVSFSRYNYTRGPKWETPELYSTSPHRKLSFHRQHEWATLLLK